jgi:hypothetical protein
MSLRKIRYRALRKLQFLLDRRAKLWRDELELWEWSPPVGGEFGSPDFDRLEREAADRLRSHQGPGE